jgi:hypothetical protein
VWRGAVEGDSVWRGAVGGDIVTLYREREGKRGHSTASLPLGVQTHFVHHLVDLLESKHALADYAPGPVGAHVLAYYLGGQHKHQ